MKASVGDLGSFFKMVFKMTRTGVVAPAGPPCSLRKTWITENFTDTLKENHTKGGFGLFSPFIIQQLTNIYGPGLPLRLCPTFPKGMGGGGGYSPFHIAGGVNGGRSTPGFAFQQREGAAGRTPPTGNQQDQNAVLNMGSTAVTPRLTSSATYILFSVFFF